MFGIMQRLIDRSSLFGQQNSKFNIVVEAFEVVILSFTNRRAYVRLKCSGVDVG